MPLLSFLVLALFGVLAGISLATQAAVNAGLRERLSSPSAAAFVSYLGGTIVMGLVLALGRRVGPPPGQLTEGIVSGVPWWAWSGGSPPWPSTISACSD